MGIAFVFNMRLRRTASALAKIALIVCVTVAAGRAWQSEQVVHAVVKSSEADAENPKRLSGKYPKPQPTTPDVDVAWKQEPAPPPPLSARQTWHRPATIQRAKSVGVTTPAERGPRQRAFDADRTLRNAAFKQQLQRLATPQNTVVVMLTNTGQSGMLWNFGCRCEHRGIPWKNGTVVYALDSEIETTLRSRGVTTRRSPEVEIHDAAKTFSDAQFAKVVFWKNAVVHDVLSMGFNVLFQDVDVVWKQDPRQWFESADPTVDIFWTYDGGNSAQQPLYVNSGFFYVRNNERTRAFWEEAYLNGHRGNSQQGTLEKLLVHHYFNNGLQLHVLDDRFVNGHLLPLGKKNPNVPEDWIVAHASWAYNQATKVEKFKAFGEWDTDCVENQPRRAAMNQS